MQHLRTRTLITIGFQSVSSPPPPPPKTSWKRVRARGRERERRRALSRYQRYRKHQPQRPRASERRCGVWRAVPFRSIPFCSVPFRAVPFRAVTYRICESAFFSPGCCAQFGSRLPFPFRFSFFSRRSFSRREPRPVRRRVPSPEAV